MSGRLQNSKLAVIDAAENLSTVESLTHYGDEDLVGAEFSYTKDLAAVVGAHDHLDRALAEYVNAYIEENG